MDYYDIIERTDKAEPQERRVFIMKSLKSVGLNMESR